MQMRRYLLPVATAVGLIVSLAAYAQTPAVSAPATMARRSLERLDTVHAVYRYDNGGWSRRNEKAL
jgi:hypothetical protein